MKTYGVTYPDSWPNTAKDVFSGNTEDAPAARRKGPYPRLPHPTHQHETASTTLLRPRLLSPSQVHRLRPLQQRDTRAAVQAIQHRVTHRALPGRGAPKQDRIHCALNIATLGPLAYEGTQDYTRFITETRSLTEPAATSCGQAEVVKHIAKHCPKNVFWKDAKEMSPSKAVAGPSSCNTMVHTIQVRTAHNRLWAHHASTASRRHRPLRG